MNLDQALEPKNTTRMIDHKAAVDEIMVCENVGRLAQVLVGLERRVGQLDVQLVKEIRGAELAAGRAEKRVAIELMGLARQRMKSLNDRRIRENQEFRDWAQIVLPVEIYESIEARIQLKKG